MATARFLHLEIDSPKPPPTEEEVAAIEEAAGAELPPALLDFLSVANGGKLDYTFLTHTEYWTTGDGSLMTDEAGDPFAWEEIA